MGGLDTFRSKQITVRARGDMFPLWRGFLPIISIILRYVMLPSISASVCFLVFYDGGAAKNVALIAVGTLFLLPIDNDDFAT